MLLKQRTSLLNMLICLTVLAIIAQTSLFILHFKASDLLDSFVKSSLAAQIWHAPILLPLLGFLCIQIASYILYIAWIWFISVSTGKLFHLSKSSTYWLGLFIWLIGCLAILAFNNYYFSDSFFSTLIQTLSFYSSQLNFIILSACAILLSAATCFAYINFFKNQQHRFIGSIFLVLAITSASLSFYNHFFTRSITKSTFADKPNIIFIGLDSVRPDYVSYFGKQKAYTPHIDAFLQSSTVFTETYTPLARTFPSWMSILTAQYPKHNHARTNLADPSFILPNDTIAKRLHALGYETMYGTDEKRFSNIIHEYGFDRIIGPDMGVNDFLLGGLSDFPLTNALINTPISQFLFPFNYANRAAAITYEPNSFLQLVKFTLAERKNKPLFLAIHLCVSHWPYTWAHDKQKNSFSLSDRYISSIEEVDQQLNDLLTILKNDGLLKNTIVVLLSDHGTALGLPGDRIISEENYSGDQDKIHWLPRFKLNVSTEDSKLKSVPQFNLNTSYGQGTDVLSLSQYHALLAIQGYGVAINKKQIPFRTSLLDVTPTILDMLHLLPMEKGDGVSLKSYLLSANMNPLPERPLFLETGFSVSAIETSDISISKVVKQGISSYQINPKNGLLYVNPLAEQVIDRNKQHAVLMGDWLLARYPENMSTKLVPKPNSKEMMFVPVKIPACFVLVNIKTGQWSIGPSSVLADKAPMKELFNELSQFYGGEVTLSS